MYKKVLKAFIKKGIHKKDRSELSYEGLGLLLHKATGGNLCKMTVNLKKNTASRLKITVDDFCCGILTPATLCFQLQELLKCKVHDH